MLRIATEMHSNIIIAIFSPLMNVSPNSGQSSSVSRFSIIDMLAEV